MNIRYIKLVAALAAAVPFAFMYDGVYTLIAYAIAFLISLLAVNILFWLFIILMAFISGFNPKNKKNSRFYGFLLNTAIIEVIKLARIKVVVTGKEKLPSEPYLLVCNHRSNFDNFIITSVIRDPYLVFISKPSNFKIPFAGRIIKRCGYLAIDRENPRNALKTIHASADLVKDDKMSVGVFPEGTRGHSEGVAPFSEGCFLVAKKAACPVVVASLRGSDDIRGRFPRKTTVYLDFVAVIDGEEAKAKRSGELSAVAYELINNSYLGKNALPSSEK